MEKPDKGVAIIECSQEIPCDPCVASCKAGAIQKASLTSCPQLDAEKCIGCRLCVAACPGQAIFFQKMGPGGKTALITFPYEYLPLPEKGSTVPAVNRLGEVVCQAAVAAVDQGKAFNKTALVTLEVPTEYADEVRFMKRPRPEE